jgi:hypothetical protein
VEAVEDLGLLNFTIVRTVKVVEDPRFSNFIIGRNRPKLDTLPVPPLCGQLRRHHYPPVVRALTIVTEEINLEVTSLEATSLVATNLVATSLVATNLAVINREATSLEVNRGVTPRTLLGETARRCQEADVPRHVPGHPTRRLSGDAPRSFRVARKERSVLAAIRVSKSDNLFMESKMSKP